MKIGYARVSTTVQNYEGQIAALEAEGCETIFREKASAKNADRPELQRLIAYARAGDVVVATKLDRLARSVADFCEIATVLEGKGVQLKILNMAGMDTATPTGKMTLTILASVAQFEREIMKERQLDGIARAKAEGKYKGRPPLAEEIRQRIVDLVKAGHTRDEVGHLVGVSRAQVYRVLQKSREKGEVFPGKPGRR